ncbi:DegT/DnrJ/EryC1/StrS family aminotransferase [Frigidibacter oleivorans]|uniref:DegT/DnrJ/EryC1/StrS family aminotransferase n=1 Tax=Frigidibacter oleivorans TaxID=2487129 RepID=UPI000F8F7B11|nr:aminotransferase class I/II-fold pyridoxal phosphate-dependent enzyme [Frigidibacter oleivorans]
MPDDGVTLPRAAAPARPALRAPDVHRAEPIPDAAWDEIERLLASGDLFRYTAASGAPVALLEAEFAGLLGSRYALACSSCSSAIFLALKALDLPRGARVLVPAFTFAAVPSAVVHADCVPVLVEVGEDLRIDLGDFRAKLADADAVLISHMRGHTSDMDAILSEAGARALPVIEDAAHSLGTRWNGRPIGTLGRVGCFSFQSYKLVNGGEGGMLVTDDPEVAARAVIMSGAYEENWRKHPGFQNSFTHWQNRLPLYNMRMQNLSAAVIRPQLVEVERRARDGLANHDHVAARLAASPRFEVPPPLPAETRAPDSIQFLLRGFAQDAQVLAFAAAARARGVEVQVFGLSAGNARAFWNWQFLPDLPDLPITRAMLRRACDVRLPARLVREELDLIADALLAAEAETA